MPGPHASDPPIPQLRGISHVGAAVIALAVAVALVASADDTRERVAALIYGVGLCALFGVSGTYHRWHGAARVKAALRRLDHATIFVFIAASYTPIGLLVLGAPLAGVVLAIAWAGALAGVVFSLGWIDAPRRWSAAAYIGLGWVAVIAAPQLVGELGVIASLLFLLGGVLYSAGAVVYARQRPDPYPATFGFHEVFHALVILAAVAHLAAMVGWVFAER